MKNVFNFANQLIEKANKVILKNYHKISKISYKKGDFNLVTNVDHEVELLILKEINSTFPSHSVIAEESGIKLKDSKYKWFIDPIDGTTNFAHRYPCFCISIGFSVNNVLEFGLVKNPATGELYSAQRRKGARLNNKSISVSKIKTLNKSLLVTGFSYDTKSKKSNFNNFKKLTLMSHGVRRDGAAAMDLCYVACGKLDGFWEFKLSPWDVAAGVLILQEASGKVTNFSGGKYDLYDKEIIATNSLIHTELLKQLG